MINKWIFDLNQVFVMSKWCTTNRNSSYSLSYCYSLVSELSTNVCSVMPLSFTKNWYSLFLHRRMNALSGWPFLVYLLSMKYIARRKINRSNVLISRTATLRRYISLWPWWTRDMWPPRPWPFLNFVKHIGQMCSSFF
jgi:hypothetical protein